MITIVRWFLPKSFLWLIQNCTNAGACWPSGVKGSWDCWGLLKSSSFIYFFDNQSMSRPVSVLFGGAKASSTVCCDTNRKLLHAWEQGWPWWRYRVYQTWTTFAHYRRARAPLKAVLDSWLALATVLGDITVLHMLLAPVGKRRSVARLAMKTSDLAGGRWLDGTPVCHIQYGTLQFEGFLMDLQSLHLVRLLNQMLPFFFFITS